MYHSTGQFAFSLVYIKVPRHLVNVSSAPRPLKANDTDITYAKYVQSTLKAVKKSLEATYAKEKERAYVHKRVQLF